MIDYLQLLSIPREWGDNRDQQIGGVTRRLKRFAADFNVPVIVLSQLRRLERVRQGHDPRPSMDDLRESGNIEADANAILLLHVPGLIEGTDENIRGDIEKAEVILAKQRQGKAPVKVPLVAEFHHTRFREPIDAAQEAPYQERAYGT